MDDPNGWETRRPFDGRTLTPPVDKGKPTEPREARQWECECGEDAHGRRCWNCGRGEC